MRETRADTAQAIVWAVLLHVLLFGLMFAGLLWTRAAAPVSVAGSPVSAELIDANALSPAMQRTLRNRPEPVETLPPPEPLSGAALVAFKNETRRALDKIREVEDVVFQLDDGSRVATVDAPAKSGPKRNKKG